MDDDRVDDDAALQRLYADFDAAGMLPLWRVREGLMPAHPTPRAVPHVWHWKDLYPLAQRAGDLVPVGRGGERRAIALANPALGGEPFTTPTLWAAVQYLGPREVAPDHRHSQSAFRFVLEGEGVWTVVDGDPVAMRRGDLLLTPGMAFHGHHNSTGAPMAWLDGLDIPIAGYLDAQFFEFGADDVADRSTPDTSRSERLWGHPGLRPLSGVDDPRTSPLMAYRWERTDAALREQLALEAEGYPGVLGPGHAAIRFCNPATGDDALNTMRLEMHRLVPGCATTGRREVGSSVWQVFEGSGAVVLDGRRTEVRRGDVVAVPSWSHVVLEADAPLDLFRFSDAPIIERLNLARTATGGGTP
ncbi:MAG TPA: cupin domain-containing protein [Mycobacteriales bacterium]|jgi:gentisate 1,2-dioxygenase|nr:cupin domain-containing protein [Mycobacteriales bacterium]